MFKGYKNHLLYKDTTNKTIDSLYTISKCKKCNKLNPIVQSPAVQNIQRCMFCSQPFYVIKDNR